MLGWGQETTEKCIDKQTINSSRAQRCVPLISPPPPPPLPHHVGHLLPLMNHHCTLRTLRMMCHPPSSAVNYCMAQTQNSHLFTCCLSEPTHSRSEWNRGSVQTVAWSYACHTRKRQKWRNQKICWQEGNKTEARAGPQTARNNHLLGLGYRWQVIFLRLSPGFTSSFVLKP